MKRALLLSLVLSRVAFATPRCDPPQTTAIVVTALAESDAPMPQRALPKGRRIGSGVVVEPGLDAPDRVAVASGHAGALVDARSGQVLAKLPAAPSYVSPKAGAIVLEGKPLRLLRLGDGKVIEPVLDGGKQPLRAAWLAASAYHRGVVALAVATDGSKLCGYLDGDFSRFALRPAPFDPNAEGYTAVLNAADWQLHAAGRMPSMAAGTPYTEPHEPRCLRAHILPDGSVACLEHAPSKPGADLRWLAGGWFVSGTQVGNVACPGTRVTLADEWGCHERATLVDPPRALVTCHDGKEQARLWTPERVFTLAAPPDSNDVGGLTGADSGPVLPVFEGRYTDAIRQTRRWIDLVGAREYSTRPLVALGVAAFTGVGVRSLAAEEKGKAHDVFLLDFARGTQERIAHVTDCAGPLAERIADGPHRPSRFLVLQCMAPAGPGRIPSRVRWSEIIDTDRRVRLRTTSLPELIFEDGVVVLSQRSRVEAETRAEASSLSSVDLLAP